MSANTYSPALLRGGLNTAEIEQISPVAAAREVELFNIALRANSNLELDWLWLYMQLHDASRRRYCLRRALEINPYSTIAAHELELMNSAA